MKALVCKNCGATLNPNTYKCEYCGTQYEKRVECGEVHYIQTCPAKTQVLGARIEVEDYMLKTLPQEEIIEFTIKRMAHSLAEALIPYMKVETEHNPMRMMQIIRGSVRVIEPDFRF